MTPWWEMPIQRFDNAILVLREARTYRRDSAKHLSQQLGISKYTLLNWELGRVKPTKATPQMKQYVIEYVKEAQEEKKRRLAIIQKVSA